MTNLISAFPAAPGLHDIDVVLVEDDDGDAKAVRRALSRSRRALPAHRMRNGAEALAFLRGEADTPPPRRYLILLDINMPRMNGHEFLRELRADPELRRAVVFMLSTSRDPSDLMAAYRHNVAGYVLKEDAGPNFSHLLDAFETYWRIVQLPVITPANAPGGPRR